MKPQTVAKRLVKLDEQLGEVQDLLDEAVNHPTTFTQAAKDVDKSIDLLFKRRTLLHKLVNELDPDGMWF